MVGERVWRNDLTPVLALTLGLSDPLQAGCCSVYGKHSSCFHPLGLRSSLPRHPPRGPIRKPRASPFSPCLALSPFPRAGLASAGWVQPISSCSTTLRHKLLSFSLSLSLRMETGPPPPQNGSLVLPVHSPKDKSPHSVMRLSVIL